ncbi:Cystatin domain [Dillenia turbinata]|uniref:Cysteine proteinase inhibitor n=1 Tax=Dillenia turbinata TaxID=194707 RepID=A0AAN8ZP37_9MAGN
MEPVPGGVRDINVTDGSNNAEIEGLGQFAVQEHNNKQNAVLEFARVLKAKEQVVAGKLYHLTLEAIDAGKKKVYEAKVWVKPWMNFKELQEFKHSHDSPSFTTSDLGAKPG